MASIRNVERHLEGGDWVSAIRECGCLLESVLHEIYKNTELNLSSEAKAAIRTWESRKGRNLLKFTLGDLVEALKAARVLVQAQNDLRRPLPYLLGADWKTLVALRNKSSHASSKATRADANFFAAYMTAFLEELGWENFGDEPPLNSPAIHPFALFKDFDALERLIKPRRYGPSSPQDVVASALLHSIQPAYYLNKLELLEDSSRRVGRNPDFNPMTNVLVDARTLVEGACALYGGLKRQEGREYFEVVHTNLELPLTTEIDEKQGSSWPEAIRCDFVGLCCYHLHLDSRKDGKIAEAAAFLQKARQGFDSAATHFERLAVPPLRDVAALWKGYALRNLGAVLADCGEPKLAGESYRRALKEREQVYQRLRHDCAPLISSQLLVEVELVKIDIAELEGKREALSESVKRLLQMRQSLPSVWPHVEELLYESAIALNTPATAELVVLAALEDRLSHLTGRKCALWIRDEVLSRKLIREALASRCGEGQTQGVGAPVPGTKSDVQLT